MRIFYISANHRKENNMKADKIRLTTIDEYIDAQPNEIRPVLRKLRDAIKKAAPESEEVISYQMPAFKFYGMLVWFGASKNHYGLYPYSKTIEIFKDKLTSYELSKGTIRFPYNKPVPVKLITEIIKFRVKENEEKEELKRLSKKKKTFKK